ncbi:nicotinamide mononucleotide transporter [Sphingomonas sp. AP4-R1]|uniref:nicotinamide riboside transporter PnuC n=1 Tax=Sphingomonas sp. AP4-R1 TaxID=2735134 RepID=UPI0014934F48|nr:nicotinamide riboside transporter PnuC [Sphingomonas sp. AP4-R1]QJU57902.1 nicotinamide mononucleotide transporter [Sphingomonas sp. AP4-R1]
MTWLEIVAVAATLTAIWLTAKRHMLCWPVNLVACALYFKLFLDERLYADMMLQAVFGLAILYGWIAWARDRDVGGTVIPRTMAPRQAVTGLAAGAVGAAAIGWFTSHHTDAALPWMDSTLTSFSLVAQVWTARRYPANWLLWIAVDIFYVGMFAFKGLALTAGLYAVMIALAILGYRRWRTATAA